MEEGRRRKLKVEEGGRKVEEGYMHAYVRMRTCVSNVFMCMYMHTGMCTMRVHACADYCLPL